MKRIAGAAIAGLVLILTGIIGGGSQAVASVTPQATTSWRTAVTFTPTATGSFVAAHWATTSGITWEVRVGLNAATALVTVVTGPTTDAWDTGALSPWPVGSTHSIDVDARQHGTAVDMTITVDGVASVIPSAFPRMTLGQVTR